MTYLTVEKRIIDGHFPRFNRTSTIKPFDKLQVVYNVYTDERPGKQAKVSPEEQVHLVFLHATGFTKESWEYWIEMFYEKYGPQLGTVISVDAVNHGESYILNEHKLGLTCSWEDSARDVLRILAAQNITSNAILIGHSMGGGTALHAAAFERRVIDSVISIEPVAYFNHDLHKFKKGRETWVGFLTKLNKYIKDTFASEEEYAQYLKKGGVGRTVHPRILEDLIRSGFVKRDDGSILAIPPRGAQITSYASSNFTTLYLRDQLKTIDCAVCHVIGSAATWNPPESVEAIRGALPNVVGVDIPDGQHLVPMERPEDTFAAIGPFFESRLTAISEYATQEVDPQTREERDAYYNETFTELKERYLSGKQIKLDRVHRL
ncbi:uncharacterized protein SAPINGB_P004117 [Magnusiomyces paraingens]|uniref:AB hydrolase-1 domain-containing protein n=1 Tax=Magnusiomyces paraingens TaxID=2606893 RepID=A0A5E8BTU0_9ASCO|nr:uncharacterized protein SAPINGB_P004117 [Saprochaete ingens]VVT54521.1 unnamed protein product [Saprochaete ingens]